MECIIKRFERKLKFYPVKIVTLLRAVRSTFLKVKKAKTKCLDPKQEATAAKRTWESTFIM